MTYFDEDERGGDGSEDRPGGNAGAGPGGGAGLGAGAGRPGPGSEAERLQQAIDVDRVLREHSRVRTEDGQEVPIQLGSGLLDTRPRLLGAPIWVLEGTTYDEGKIRFQQRQITAVPVKDHRGRLKWPVRGLRAIRLRRLARVGTMRSAEAGGFVKRSYHTKGNSMRTAATRCGMDYATYRRLEMGGLASFEQCVVLSRTFMIRDANDLVWGNEETTPSSTRYEIEPWLFVGPQGWRTSRAELRRVREEPIAIPEAPAYILEDFEAWKAWKAEQEKEQAARFGLVGGVGAGAGDAPKKRGGRPIGSKDTKLRKTRSDRGLPRKPRASP
jgi:hypothetical protein